MGRYICTGIIYQYGFAKSSFRRIDSQDVKQQLISQLFPVIYDFWEDESYFYFVLSSKVSVSDIVSLMKTYFSLRWQGKEEREELARVLQLLNGKTMTEAYGLAKEKQSYLFQSDELGYSYAYYAIPLVFNGERRFYPVHIWCMMIENSSAKTTTEDYLLSYDFFTDLLRYRMKPERLADTMLIYLSN